MEIVFNEFRDRLLLFFGSLGSGFSGFLGLENRFENEVIFSEKQMLRGGAGGGNLAGIWAL